MFQHIEQSWSREAVGYRQGELEEGDGLAAVVVLLVGGPALIVGGALITGAGVALGQVLLLAPLAAILGAGVVGTSATMAAQTGAAGTWLLRPAFGSGGAVIVSLLRLLMVGIWAVMGLQMAGGWTASAASNYGIELPGWAWIAVIAGLALLGAAAGVANTVTTVIRRPLLVGSVLLMALLGWIFASDGVVVNEGDGSFWGGLQLALEMAVVFVPFVETIARRLRSEDDAMSSFSVSYAVGGTLTLAAGAVLAVMFGSLEGLIGVGETTAGAALVIAWVLIAEVDQTFAAMVGAGQDAVGVVRFLPAWLVGLLIAAGIGAAAALSPPVPIEAGALAVAVVFPAALIAATDFHVVKDHYYAESDLYGPSNDRLNWGGFLCWLLAVVLGQLLQPVGPALWVEWVPEMGVDPDLPWRLLAAAAMSIVYFLLTRWTAHRRAAVFEMRGMSS